MRYIGLHRPDGATAEVAVHNGFIHTVTFYFKNLANYVDHCYDGIKAGPAIAQLESFGWEQYSR